jgi:uncharacterized protein (DUF305 family)
MRIRMPVVAALVPLALLAAACGDDDNDDAASGGDGTTTTAPAPAGGHNEADAEFVRMMIPHHEQAVAMAELAPDRAEDAFILDIATRIQEAQGPEIEQMTGWLEEWGEDLPTEGAAGHDMGDTVTSAAGGEMADGMMDGADMAALEAARGAEFDRMFAEMMIEHHQGAIDMANDEIAAGQDPDAIALAEAIVDAQEGEIAEFEAFLGQPS